MTNPGDALSIVSLTAGFGRLQIVSGISFQVRPGELYALLGRNGVGKSTTLLSVAGQRFGMNTGEVLLGQVNLSSSDSVAVAQAGISLVPEGRRIFPTLSVRDNLQLGAFLLRKRSKQELNGLFERVYELFPALKSFSKTQAALLSGGQQQMVAIGQALMASPRFVLLDEPTAGIAPGLAEELYAVLHTLKSEGIGMVIVDQSLERALRHCDRYAVMDDGTLAQTGNCADPGTFESVSSIMLAAVASVHIA